MQELTTQKREARRHFRALRAATPAELRARWDQAIHARLYALDRYREADSIFLFLSYADEIDTWPILSRALAEGRRVAAPHCLDLDGRMAFYWIRGREDLMTGAYGIEAPDPDRCPPAEATERAICLLPGLSFDREGHRLGYGRGYYDRFLARFSGHAIGLCYEQALTDRLPHDAFDLPADILLTEARTLLF